MASDESGAEEPQADKAKDGKKPEDKKADEAKTEAVKMAEEPPILTRHVVTIDGQELRYTVTTGMLPIKNDKGEIEAGMFFMAYTKDFDDSDPQHAQAKQDRTLMFSFNGGPGSSSVWLHLGALGPKRVPMLEDGSLPPPPYRLVDNPHTWLDKTDLVFIDPVGTGYSRAAKPELGKKFWSLEGDIASVGEFIRLYLTRYERWASPLYLVGESYGTTRAAGLAGYLIDRGIAFNGILLVSSILNFQTALMGTGNDLPYILFLPTYAATAWYHKQLAPDLQADLQQTLREAETWAAGEYALALMKGSALSEEERRAAIVKLARYTGLSEQFVDDSDLRIDLPHFCKELLRSQKRTVGRLDSRITGRDARAVGSQVEFDPSMSAIRPPYTSAFNHYARTELGYKTDLPYFILGEGRELYKEWDWNIRQGYADTSDALRSAFAKNPYMRLFVASGYYDFATPYFATQYTLNHIPLDPETRHNIVTAEYEAGHMMYIHAPSLAKLKADVTRFLEDD